MSVADAVIESLCGGPSTVPSGMNAQRPMTDAERTQDFWAGLVFLVGLLMLCIGLAAGFTLWGAA